MRRFVGPLTMIRFHSENNKLHGLRTWLRRRFRLYASPEQMKKYFVRHCWVVDTDGNVIEKMGIDDINYLVGAIARPMAEMCGLYDVENPHRSGDDPIMDIYLLLVQVFHDPALDSPKTREQIARNLH